MEKTLKSHIYIWNDDLSAKFVDFSHLSPSFGHISVWWGSSITQEMVIALRDVSSQLIDVFPQSADLKQFDTDLLFLLHPAVGLLSCKTERHFKRSL